MDAKTFKGRCKIFWGLLTACIASVMAAIGRLFIRFGLAINKGAKRLLPKYLKAEIEKEEKKVE